MKSITKEFELQLDEKPNGFVIRLNDKEKCVLRICQIPKTLNVQVDFIDATYTKSVVPEFMQKIDWKLLREQKKVLMHAVVPSHELDAIEGIVHLIDALQDYASDDMGLGDKLVFNLDENGDEINLEES